MISDPSQQTEHVDDTVAAFPLSTTQQRCWFLDQMQPGNPALNVAVRWEVRGRLTETNLERAFQLVIDRHEILRTRFVEVDGAPEQQVVEKVVFKLDSIDLRRLSADEQTTRIDEIAHETAARPFDLGFPGLIRATLIWLSAEHAIIVFVVHQSCFDGYSIRVLGREIGTATQAFEEGREPDLPDLPLQFGDFAMWQSDYLNSGVLEEESSYWLKTLDNLGYFEIQPDKPRPRVKSTKVSAVMLDLPADFGPNLERVAQRIGVSPFTFGAAVLSACLERITGTQDVLFGTQIAGRLDTDLEALIGVFINNLVLRFPTDPTRSFADHAMASKAVIEGALSHQTMPFNKLVELINPRRDPARSPLISINFNLQVVFMESKTYGAFDLRSSRSHAPGAIYDLNFAVMSRPTGWQLNLEYAVSLFEEKTALAIIELVSGAFACAFANTTAPLSDIPVPSYLQTRGDDDRKAIRAAEQVLMGHPMVREAAVLQANEKLYAFVVPGDTGSLPLEKLPRRLMESFAESSAAPLTGISLLGAFPRTVMGDVNKALLELPRFQETTSQPEARPDVIDALKADWAEILGVSSVSSDAHFFDLGGHSVLVLRQIAKVRDRWGVPLDVTALYENAVLSDLARMITAQLEPIPNTSVAPKSDWRFMTLAAKGEGQPLIAINNAATGLALATAGAKPRRVYCARVADGDRGLKLNGQSFEEIARAYADVVKSSHPEGPYFFYGNCVHGNLALETARILQAEGAQIAGVVMKDVWEPTYTDALMSDPKMRRLEKKFAYRMRRQAVRDGEMTWYRFMRTYSVFRKTGILKLAMLFGIVKVDQLTDLDEQQLGFISHVSRKRDVYRPGPVTFPVLHIVTNATPQGPGFLPSIGWEKIIDVDCLKTVHLDKVLIQRGRRIGVEAMAAEIDRFLEVS